MSDAEAPGPPEGLAEFYDALLRFHLAFQADHAAGTLHSVRHYQRMFPGYGAAVAAEYARLRAADPPVEIPSSADGTLGKLRPGSREHIVPREEIARGGMGAILRVRDEVLLRDLAMKQSLQDAPRSGDGVPAVPASPPATSPGVRRFVQEAQVTAQLDHPGVVPVHEMGVDGEGRLFFTMKLVRGRTLAEILRLARSGSEGWTLTRAVQVFLRICDTIGFAHSKGVIHRDLKPPNIMVGGFGEVYVMDWGLSKVLRGGAPGVSSSTLSLAGDIPSRAPSSPDNPLTLAGAVIGTPQYMPLEQACGLLDHLDARTDVYSIGAMLYQLLAGVPPYGGPSDTGAPRDVLAAIRAGPPRPIREINPSAPPELEAIARKAMARLPGDRYGSAGELSEDLQRWIEGRVVLAYRTGPLVELRKWFGRNRLVAGILAGGALLALAAAIGFGFYHRENARRSQWEAEIAANAEVKAESERRRAEREAEAARASAKEATGNYLCVRAQGVAATDPGLSLLLAMEGAALSPGRVARDSLYKALANLREVRTLTGHDGYVMQVEYGPDGALLASRENGTQAILWNPDTGEILHRLDEHEDDLTHLAFDPAGGRLVTTSFDGTARLWNVASGRCTAVLRGHDGCVTHAAFSPDGRTVATAGDDGTARLWDAVTGAPLRTLPGHGKILHHLEFAPDGLELSTSSTDGICRTWEVATGEPRLRLLAFDMPRDKQEPRFPRADATSAQNRHRGLYDRRGTRLLAWAGRAFRIYALPAGELLRSMGGDEKEDVYDAHWIPGTDHLFLDVQSLTGGPATMGIWDPATGEWVRRFEVPGHAKVSAWTGAGSLAILGDIFVHDAAVVDPRAGRALFRLLGHSYEPTCARIRPDGNTAATASCDGTVRIWNLRHEEIRRGVEDGGRSWLLAYTPDGTRGLRLSWNDGDPLRKAELVDLLEGRVIRKIAECDPDPVSATFSDDGRRLGVRTVTGYRVFELGPFREVPLPDAPWRREVWAGDLSPDGTRLLVRSLQREGVPPVPLVVHDLRSPGAPPVALGEPAPDLHATRWSPDGRRILTANRSRGTATLFDAATGAALTFRGHVAWVLGAAWSPDGRWACTTAVDQTAQVWDADTGAVVSLARGLPKETICPAFSPDGRVLALGHVRGIDLFDVDAAGRLSPRGSIPASLNKFHPRIWFTPQGRVAALEEGDVVRLWDLDPLAVARARAPRALTPVERRSFDVGTEGERRAEEEEYYGRLRSAVALCKVAAENAKAGDIAGALARLDRAERERPRYPPTHLLRAALLAHRSAGSPAGSRERDADLGLALDALRRALAIPSAAAHGVTEGSVRSDESFAPLRELPGFEAALQGK